MKTITSNNNIFKNHGSTDVDSQTVENVFSFLESLGFSNIDIDFDGDDMMGSINGDFNKKDISNLVDSEVAKSFGFSNVKYFTDLFNTQNNLTQTEFKIDDLGFQQINGDVDDSISEFVEYVDDFILSVFDTDNE